MTWHFPLLDGEFVDFAEAEDIYNILMASFCVLCAGLAAGLTMGLLSLDITKLELKLLNGSEAEKKQAAVVLPIVKKHHLLLVTLLLFNSVSNESLPIFLGELFPNYVAVLVSVTLVLVFGEIIPSALFTGPRQLAIAARLTPLVSFLMSLFWPIAWPIGRLLDYCFGKEEGDTFSRDDFEALLQLQTLQLGASTNTDLELAPLLSTTPYQMIPSNDTTTTSATTSQTSNSNGRLTKEEINILAGVLLLNKRRVIEKYIPLDDVYMIPDNAVLSPESLQSILNSGFSRLPVCKGSNKQHVIGYLLVKSLAVLNPKDHVPVNCLPLREPIVLHPNTSLMEALSQFRKQKCHFALVSEHSFQHISGSSGNDNDMTTTTTTTTTTTPKVMGILTMEDTIEQLIQDQIVDETDTPTNQMNPMVNTIHLGHSKSRVAFV